MKVYHCDKCNIRVAGRKTCPLCGNYVGERALSEEARPELGYPAANNEIIVKNILFKVLIFVCIISIVAVMLIDFLVNLSVSWSLYILVGWVLFWMTVGRAVFFHMELRRQLVWDCVLGTLLSLYIEYVVHGSLSISVNWIVPAIITACMGAMSILMLTHYKTWNRYALPMSTLCLFSVIPLITVLSLYHEAFFMIYIPATLGVLAQIALMIFGREKYFIELKKKYHI